MFLGRSSFLTFFPYFASAFLYRRERDREWFEEERCRGHGGFVASFPKILREPARVRKRHFIKNKFREGADGYPRASRGFHAADSLPHFLLLYLSTSHSLFLSPIHNSNAFLVCLVNVISMSPIFLSHFHCTSFNSSLIFFFGYFLVEIFGFLHHRLLSIIGYFCFIHNISKYYTREFCNCEIYGISFTYVLEYSVKNIYCKIKN